MSEYIDCENMTNDQITGLFEQGKKVLVSVEQWKIFLGWYAGLPKVMGAQFQSKILIQRHDT